MAGYTRFTNLEVTGKMKAKGGLDITKSTYAITSDSATAAAGTAPTKAEFDKVVTLINEIKTDYNKLVNQLATGSDS